MRKNLILMLVLFFSCTNSSLFAQTNVSGGIYTNTTWTLANSPYLITGPIVVFPGKTLTIEPGVEVRVKENIGGTISFIEVRGNIVAVGTQNQPITFQGDALLTEKGTWQGILLKGTQGATGAFDYINMRNSNYGISTDQDVDTLTTFHSCNFSYNHRALFPFSSIKMEDCTFTYNTEAIGSNVSSIPTSSTFVNCLFENNDVCLVWMDGITTIDSCLFQNNYTGLGSYLDGVVKNTRFFNNGTAMAATGSINVSNCLFDNNSTAVYSITNASITNSIFTNNDFAIGLGDFAIVTGNTISDNVVAVKLWGQPNQFRDNQICNNSLYNIEHTTDKNYALDKNCYCETDSTILESKIYDGYDDISKGLLNYAIYDSTCVNIISYVTKVNLSTSIGDESKTSKISLYPNPVKDLLMVDFDTNISENDYINIYDLQGKLWINEKIGNNKYLQISTQMLPTGMYFLEFVSSSQKSHTKFIKD